MPRTILITGATDGIGFATARMLFELGHHVLLHGRSRTKLERAEQTLSALGDNGKIESYLADFSRMAEVEALAQSVSEKHPKLDVLINNAGIYTASETITRDGLDVRFAVNTIAPYLLTRRLLSLLGKSGRVINLSSAAQTTVNLEALAGTANLTDNAAYAQSKLALTMWSRHLALSLNSQGPAIVAINPGSLLATKMVKQAYGVAGADIQIGAQIICRAAIEDEFAAASGQYFDNDSGHFASPHPDARDPRMIKDVVDVIEGILAKLVKPWLA